VSDQEDDYYYNHPNGGWVDTDPEESCQRTILRSQVAAMRDLQEETVLIQVLQMEMRMKMVTTTQVHQMVVTMTMMIQSQPPPQAHHHLSPTMRSRYFTWTLLRVHSPRFSGGHAEDWLPANAML
jgi:hypothetical protein